MPQLTSTHGFRVSAHLGYLFQELPLAARFAAARQAGFRAIEIPNPYLLPLSAFQSLCERNELQVAQIALPNGTTTGSKKGLAALSGREVEFEDALKLSVDFATAVNCPFIHPMSGIRTPLEPSPDWSVYLVNLEKACSAAADNGLGVIIEPISAYGVRNYFMSSLTQACAAIEEIGAPNLRLSIDTYHAAAMGVPLSAFIVRHSSKVGHVQLADWPKRNEPGSGQFDFDPFLRALTVIGYKGYVGLEYIPSSSNADSFGWLRRFEAQLEQLRVGEPLAG